MFMSMGGALPKIWSNDKILRGIQKCMPRWVCIMLEDREVFANTGSKHVEVAGQ